MVVHPLRAALVLTVLFAAARFAPGAVSSAEDLTGCKLPNGRAVLPLPGTAQAANGTLYKIANNTFSSVPAAPDGKPLPPDDMLAKIRDAKTADIQFLPDNKGTLWAFSGCIADVPDVLFLSETSGKKLDEPGLIPKTSRNPSGQYNDIQEGAVYIFKTTDSKYAIFRVLEKTAAALVVQFVYQPDGTLNFSIPVNTVIAYQAVSGPAPTATAPASPTPGGSATVPPPAAGAVATTTLPPSPRVATATPTPPKPQLGPGDIIEPGRIVLLSGSQAPSGGAVPSIDTFTRQRTQLLHIDTAIISAPARTDAEKDRKTQAIHELAALHADEPEVADLLVANISFMTNGSNVREFSPEAFLPCFATLKRLGATGAAAALKGMRALDLDGPGIGTDAPTSKADLLGRVVRAVEGDDVAEFIFRREAAKDPDPKHRAVFEYALEKR